MFRHNSCKSPVHLDLSGQLKILSVVGVLPQKKSFNAPTLSISMAESARLSFFCMSCNKQITSEEVRVDCSHCGRILTFDEAHVSRDSSSIYCESCAKEWETENTIPLSNFNNVKLHLR